MGRLTALLLPLLLAGCVGFSYDRQRVGTPRPVVDAGGLTPGVSTLGDVLRRLGPPDVILRVGHVDRAYYVAWDSTYFKFVVEAGIPLSSRNVSWDAFILALGSEEFRLARLEFDRDGTLRDLQLVDYEASRNGNYFAIDNRIVENFLEDRSRSLHIVEMDDDEEDVELDNPK